MALYFASYVNSVWENYSKVHNLRGDNEKIDPEKVPCGWYVHDDESFKGWSRVISLFDGKATFHVPDDFDLGSLKQIEPNWDGHTTEEKWDRICKKLNIEGEVRL